MRSNKRPDNRSLLFLGVLALTGIFYFFILGNSSYAMYADSATYIKWSFDAPVKSGYALYTVFLKTCRRLFGENDYLQAVNYIQCLLALITSIVLEEYIRKNYRLGYIWGYIAFLAICGVYGYSLPEVVASHYIVTESLTFPFFSLILLFLLKYINERSFLSLVIAFGICTVLAMVRPQMVFFALIIIFIVALNELSLKFGNKEKRAKKLVNMAVPLFVLATAVGLYIVVLVTVGVFSGNSNSQYHEAVMAKVMCVMEENDSSFYEDDIRGGYETLYQDTYDNNRLKENFPNSILEYEKVQRIIDLNMARGPEVVWNWHNTTYGPIDKKGIDSFRNRIVATELDAHRLEYIGVILRLIPSSLVSSIFIQPPQIRLMCNIVAFALYIIAIALVYVAYHKGMDRKYYMPMVVSLIMIYGNALLSNIVLYGQQRYVVYCFGIFYISMVILIKQSVYRKEVEEHEFV